MSDAKFSIAEALKYGWTAFRAKIGFFIALTIITTMATALPDYLVNRIFGERSTTGLVLSMVIRLVGVFISMVTTMISLDIYDEGDANLSKTGTMLSKYFRYLFGKLLYGILVSLALLPELIVIIIMRDFSNWVIVPAALLLAVPAIFLSFRLLYVGYLVVDRGLGPIAALKESWAITDGQAIWLFLFSMAIVALNLLGLVAILIGLLVTIPMTLMASAYVYRQLSPRAAA